MPTSQSRYTPVVILLLLAALVAMSWLYVAERAAGVNSSNGEVSTGPLAGPEQRRYEWKLVTAWPKNFPGLGRGPETFARIINEMSDGRLTVRVYGGGEIVPALEVFSAVSQGTVAMGHAAAYYWKGKIPSAPFFTAVPFGLTAQEQNGWLHYTAAAWSCGARPTNRST